MQQTAFGKAELGLWMKVQKVDGRVFYRKVVGDKEIEVTEAEYLAAHEEKDAV